MRIQLTNFLVFSSSAVLAERCPRTSRVVNSFKNFDSSRFLLRFAQPFLAKLERPTFWSLYPKSFFAFGRIRARSGVGSLLSNSISIRFCHPAFIKIWSIQNLRLHLAQKLSIAIDDILVNSANETLDVGSCNCGGPRCFAASKTPIEFIINGKVLDLLKPLY
jgi:hypothetical protein